MSATRTVRRLVLAMAEIRLAKDALRVKNSKIDKRLPETHRNKRSTILPPAVVIHDMCYEKLIMLDFWYRFGR